MPTAYYRYAIYRWFSPFIALILPLYLMGQDIHFSHIHASPTQFNPAMMGLFNGELRLIANYKSQWQTFDDGFRTFAASVDGKMMPLGRSNLLAGGLQFYSDKAGELDFSTNNIAGALSLIQVLDRRQRNLLAIGIQNAYTTQRFNLGNIRAFDEEIGLDKTMLQNRSSYLDLSAGVGWFNQYTRDNFIYFGAAIYHINEPFSSFYEAEIPNGLKNIRRKYVLHGGADFKLNRYSSIKPSFIFMKQGTHAQLTLGAFWKYKADDGLGGRSKKHFYMGLWTRVVPQENLLNTDALIAAIRYDYEDLIITLTFDFNISQLRAVSYSVGGPELSVIQTFSWPRSRKKRHKVKCPDL